MIKRTRQALRLRQSGLLPGLLGVAFVMALLPHQADAAGPTVRPTTQSRVLRPRARMLAQNTATQVDPRITTTVAPIAEEKKEESRFTLLVDASTSASMQKEGDVSRVAENSITVAPRVRLTSRLNLAAELALTQELTGERNTTLSNVLVAASLRPAEMSSNFSWSPSVSFKAPTDTISNKQDSFQGAGGASIKLELDPKWAWKAKFQYALSATKNVHEYTLNADGDANIAYLVTNSIGAALPITENIAISAAGSYVNAWTYHDFNRQRFDIAEQLSWEALSKWTLYVGHSNKGSALKANGRDSNVNLFSENTSVFSVGTNYLF